MLAALAVAAFMQIQHVRGAVALYFKIALHIARMRKAGSVQADVKKVHHIKSGSYLI